MEEKNLYRQLEKAAELLSLELKKSREREQKLEYALKEIFPMNLYKQIRKDVAKAFEKDSDIIEHFVQHAAREFNFKSRAEASINYLAKKITLSCLRDTGIFNEYNTNTAKPLKDRTLLKTKGNPINLQKNKDHEFALSHSSIHYKSNSICTWIPKNGCSNIRYSIALANGAIADIGEIEWIHDNNDCFIPNTKELLAADYTYIILRNPFKRLLSFFLDKLCHSEQQNNEMSYQNAKNCFQFNSNMCFADFVNYIWENPNTIYFDEHTRPQCDFVAYRHYDNYFSLEEFGYATKTISEKTGLIIHDIRSNNSIYTSKNTEKFEDITHETEAFKIRELYSQNKSPITENMYSNSIIKKVASIYIQDIILYHNYIQNGYTELEYWLRRSF